MAGDEGDLATAEVVTPTTTAIAPVVHGSAWQATDIRESDWLVPIPPAAMAELDTIAAALADYDEPLDTLNYDGFDWPAMTELMVEVRRRVDDGTGVAILDRLPVERWTDTAVRAVTWLLNDMLAPPIMQKWKGHRVYDVRDTGAKLAYGVRRSVTNLSQEFHTDGSFLELTPDFFSLTCVRQAATGGKSRLASLTHVHNILAERHPRHLERLYQPFWWDRQAEHAPDERPANWLPVFERTGDRLSVRYYDDYIRNGHKLMRQPIDPAGDAALRAMQVVIEDPENWVEFRLAPGQLEFAHNRLIAHARTAFRDAAAERGGRLLLRYWLRTAGGIQLDADPALVG